MVKIVNHTLDQDVLLSVLLTEVRIHRVVTRSGANNVEELIHHGQHTVKVAGAGRTLKLGAQLAARNADERVTVGVHLFNLGGKNNVNTGGTSQGSVCLQGARVCFVILAGAKLQRVHENGGDHYIILFSGATQQGCVAVMQGAHGGHVAQGCVLVLNCGAVLLRLLAGCPVQFLLRCGKRFGDCRAELRNGGHDSGHRSLSHDENSLFSGAESSISPGWLRSEDSPSRSSIRPSCSSFNKPLLCALFAVACARAA